jgi:poly-gamma-glutamate synthase PgsB/CapB
MWSGTPDPGVMNMYFLDDRGRQITFVNGFAANDPESTGQNWNMVVDRFASVERRIALFNCRADRPDRSVQLAEACVRWKPADHYVLIGSATQVFWRRAAAMGLDARRMTCAEKANTAELVDTLRNQSGRTAMVMGMGNISGPGFDVVDYFRQRACPGHTFTAARKEAA